MRLRKRQRGVAIWVVFCICIVLFILLYAFVETRVETKGQHKHTFLVLKAQWAAQAAIQHALVKFRILPTESYDASALARGVCPFYTASGALSQGSPNDAALEAFRLDITSELFPFEYDGVDGISYSVVEMTALNSFNRDDLRVHVVRVKAIGTANGFQPKVGTVTFTDELVKTVDVQRNLAL